MYNITCPHCKSEALLQRAPFVGEKLTCPECKKWFTTIDVVGDKFTFWHLDKPKFKIPGKKKKKT